MGPAVLTGGRVALAWAEMGLGAGVELAGRLGVRLGTGSLGVGVMEAGSITCGA